MSDQTSHNPPRDAAATTSREQRLAERILEDETLRGDLDDATWQPIQDWLLAAIHQAAVATAGLPDEAAWASLDRLHAALKRTVADKIAEIQQPASQSKGPAGP